MSDEEHHPPPATPEIICSHCGARLPAGTRVCPNCGNIVATVAPKQWPPRPTGQPKEPTRVPPDRAEVRRLVNEGMTFGCTGFIGAWVLVMIVSSWLIERFPGIKGSMIGAAIGDCAPAAAFIALYFFMKSERPYTARGIGFAILIAIPLAFSALALGALKICG